MHGLEFGDSAGSVALLAALFLLFAVILLTGAARRHGPKPRYSKPQRSWAPPTAKRPRRPWAPAAAEQDHTRDLLAARQIRAVTDAAFQKKRILSYAERRVFKIVENELLSIRRGYRAFPQTNLGEILGSSNEDAFLAINSKRVDILVVDSDGWPVLAVEYQGEGHYQGTAIARDTIKNLALRSAGIGYFEIFSSDGDKDIRVQLRAHLARNQRGPEAVALRDPA